MAAEVNSESEDEIWKTNMLDTPVLEGIKTFDVNV